MTDPIAMETNDGLDESVHLPSLARASSVHKKIIVNRD